MPTPKRDETQQEFVSRCVPIVIEDQGLNAGDERERRQAVAICYSMWRQAKKEGESMSEETTITTDDIADVLVDDNVTVTHPVMKKQATTHTAVRLHGQGGIFSVQGEGEEKQLGGATSFGQLEEMRQTDAIADDVEGWATTFRDLATNIMLSSDVEDKSAALGDLAKEFTGLVEGRMNEATKGVDVTKELIHYKEVDQDDTLAQDEDFKGGCPHCLFGDPVAMKSLDKCPFCHNVIGGRND